MHSIQLHLHINTFLLLRNSLLEKAFCLVTQNHSNKQIFQSSLHTYNKLQSFRCWTSVGSFPCTAYTIKDVFNNLYMKRGISKNWEYPFNQEPLQSDTPQRKVDPPGHPKTCTIPCTMPCTNAMHGPACPSPYIKSNPTEPVDNRTT